jgi:putative transcriptional regulator
MKAMKTNIAYYRDALGLTQEKLAEKVAATRQTIISLEQGRYNPSLLLAYKITKALGQKNIEDVFIIK